MNQILLTSDEKSKASLEIKPIIRFFAVSIIVFAIILIGEGAYNLSSNTKNEIKDYPIPTMVPEKNGSYITLKVNGDIGINKVIYAWDDGIETEYSGNGKKRLSFDIEIPQGEHNLKTSIVDIEGNKTKYDDMPFSFTAEEDTLKPVISIEKSGNKLEITALDETELDYFSYQWEGLDEVIFRPTEDNKTMVKELIDVEEGTKKIELIAVDKSGNKQTVTRKVIGSTGPSISATIADNSFVVKVTDEIEITKIVYTHNGEELSIKDIPKGAKEFEFKVPLKDGENYLKINAYENSIMSEYRCKKTK